MPGSIDTSLVRIHTEAGGVAGAGFLVGERYILTCAHVIAQALGLADDAPDPPSSLVSLDFPRLALHTQFTAQVIFWEPVQADGRGDIAGLELLDKPPVGAGAVHFAPADQVWDHSFRALGFPSGYNDGVWVTGRLLGRLGTNWIQIEDVKVPGFAVISGFSGAPVWDEQLQGIVGMVVASSLQATAKAAFVIPTDVLLAAWPQLADIMRPLVPRNPYKGLLAFTEHDARDFFGRDTLIDELATAVVIALTREQKEGKYARLLAVLGPSGSGKSSVVMAGLLPCLHDGRVLNSKEWMYLDLAFPGAHPLGALAVSLAKQLPARDAVSVHDELASASAHNLHLLVSQLVASWQQRVVLIVDQFEEVFTLTTDEAERQHFFELLVTAVTEPRGPLFVILLLRADFYHRAMHYPELYRLIDRLHVPVLPLTREELRRVIEQPANLPEVQLTFENGLVDELLYDMQGQSGALPLLEFTLDQLVQRRNGHQLTLQAYREMGGVKGALSGHAEETYPALPSDEPRRMARDVFLRLLVPGATEQDTIRRRADRSEFEQVDSVQTRQMHETLERFIRARLLTTNRIAGKTTVEVSHEALIREWRRLAEWLREAPGDILFQRSLSDDVIEWEQRTRPRDRLYRGVQLKEAQAWARRNRPSELEMAFLHASATQRILWLVGVIAVVLLLVPSITFVGWYVLHPSPSTTLVTTLQDNNEAGSLRWCINNASSGSTIRFAQGIIGTIKLTKGDLVFTSSKQLTIAGPGADQLMISGGNIGAHIRVSKGATLNISGLSFKNSETVDYAFLSNEGTLIVTNSIISGNKTTAGDASLGGGIENKGTLTVTKSTISNNSSIGDHNGLGGGIDNQGKLTVTGSTFSNNKTSGSSDTGFGGGIFNYSTGTLMVTTSTFSDNSSSGDHNGQGGGIENDGKLTVTNSTFSNNSANSGSNNSFGGGIFNRSTGTLMVTTSTFSDNSSSGDRYGQGGGIQNEGKLTVTDSTFSNNKASSSSGTSFGGGIFNYSTGTLMVTTSTFSDNSASGKQYSLGGGIENEGKLTVIDSTFSGNSATGKQDSFGGGIFYFGLKGSFAIIRFSTIYGNTSNAGGGIWTDPKSNSQVTLSSSIIAANNAKNGPDISGVLISDGYNLIEHVAGAIGLNASTDRQVTLADLNIDSLLGNNGGPTQTLALQPGSPAIDAVPQQACSITITDPSGNPVTITTDQRGDPRPDGSE